MARRRGVSLERVFATVLQSVLGGAGLLGGLALGAAIIYLAGLLDGIGRVVEIPFDSLTKTDLFRAMAPFVIVGVCGWFGMRFGMALAAKIDV